MKKIHIAILIAITAFLPNFLNAQNKETFQGMEGTEVEYDTLGFEEQFSAIFKAGTVDCQTGPGIEKSDLFLKKDTFQGEELIFIKFQDGPSLLRSWVWPNQKVITFLGSEVVDAEFDSVGGFSTKIFSNAVYCVLPMMTDTSIYARLSLFLQKYTKPTEKTKPEVVVPFDDATMRVVEESKDVIKVFWEPETRLKEEKLFIQIDAGGNVFFRKQIKDKTINVVADEWCLRCFNGIAKLD